MRVHSKMTCPLLVGKAKGGVNPGPQKRERGPRDWITFKSRGNSLKNTEGRAPSKRVGRNWDGSSARGIV